MTSGANSDSKLSLNLTLLETPTTSLNTNDARYFAYIAQEFLDSTQQCGFRFYGSAITNNNVNSFDYRFNRNGNGAFRNKTVISSFGNESASNSSGSPSVALQSVNLLGLTSDIMNVDLDCLLLSDKCTFSSTNSVSNGQRLGVEVSTKFNVFLAESPLRLKVRLPKLSFVG